MPSVEAELRAQRPRRAAGIAICLALWGGLYGAAGSHEIAEIAGDILLLTAFGLAVITPWTQAQIARETRRRAR